MIRILGVDHSYQIVTDLSIDDTFSERIKWFWVDFDEPTEEEAVLLDHHFKFHPLAIEDCFHALQRPKLDYYDNYHFMAVHAINASTLEADEVDVFLGSSYMVTYHMKSLREIEEVWQRAAKQESIWRSGPLYIAYLVMDKLVDYYFPSLYQIEDELLELDNQFEEETESANVKIMNDLFDVRARLLKLRRTIVPMRDLLYRLINSSHIEGVDIQKVYFTDIHDHLLKLSDMIDSNREMTSDIRDSYMSLSSNRMNTIMKTLTVITTIFMPLTFLAGIYGMNFKVMPELTWHYGYFIILVFMGLIGVSMFFWFWRKGWFK